VISESRTRHAIGAIVAAIATYLAWRGGLTGLIYGVHDLAVIGASLYGAARWRRSKIK
jgi:hypothetical protein